MMGIRYGFPLMAIALTVAVAGCTLEPRFTRPPSPVAATYPAPAGSGTVTADEIGWRDFFTDPRLQRLIGLALQNNRDLRVAILNVEQAHAENRIARAALFPTLNGNASFTRSRTPADLSPFGTSVIGNNSTITADAAWEIDLFGKNRSLSRAAVDKYLATQEARRAAQISLVAQVADQYLTIQAYEKELAVTADVLTTAQASLALAKAEFGAGNQTALDLAEAETVVDQAQANQAQQLRLRDQANNALELLVGEPIPADLPPPLPLDDQNLLAEIPAGLPSNLLTRRPDILEAEDSLRAADADIGAARAAFFPSLSLTGEYGTASSALTGLFGSNRAIWSFGPSLNLPVFEGGTNFANLESAKAQKGIAVAEYEKAIQAGFREVADELVARATYGDQIAALARDEDAQQTRLDLSTLRFRNGIDSYLSVLTAENDLYSVQFDLVTNRLACATNLVNLYESLGGGWLEHGTPRTQPSASL